MKTNITENMSDRLNACHTIRGVMSQSSIIALVVTLSLVFLSCTKKNEPEKSKSFRVGLVLDKGGKDDKSFNAAAFLGASNAVAKLGIELKDVESPDDSSFEPSLRAFAEKGMDLVIAIGFSQRDALLRVAPQFPNTKFAIVDAEISAPNVTSLMFAEHEGSYLVGYLAGLTTKTNTVGFIGGMDIPLIHRFELGYAEGAKAANSKIKVLVNYAGITSDAWTNPSRGKELALGQIANGADIIFHAAGATGMGVFDAVEEKQKLAIGVDSNQDWVKPGRILTSMLKRVDVAVFDVIDRTKKNQFKAGTVAYGLADTGVDYSIDRHNEKLVEPYKAKLEEIRQKIIKGEIKVPDYYVVRKSK